MKNTLIVYLNPDSAEDLPESFTTYEWAESIAKHPDRVEYTHAEFVLSFNTEEISDLGYTVLIDADSREILNW